MHENDDEPSQDEAPASDTTVTPGREPSALERGARIFERLRRRALPDPDEPDRD